MPSASMPSAGMPSAGMPSAGMPSAGMPSAGAPSPGGQSLAGDATSPDAGTGHGRQAPDILAPAPTGSILTTAPRQEAGTAGRSAADVTTETIAAELAGWAAGELPGQASARLAAWAAIGGVPAAGYRQADASDVGGAGVGTERVR